jgi:hypothetical protein
MTVADFFCGGVFLPAVGLLFKRSKPTGKTSANKAAAFKDHTQNAVEAELEALRAIHQVELVSETDEGSGITHLPNGVYGYSCAPQLESPLFRKKIFRSFEVHKLLDGQVHIIGFVTEAEAAQLLSAGAQLDVNLYPEPWGESVKLVSIPVSRMLRHKGPSRDKGNALSLRLVPATETVQ